MTHDELFTAIYLVCGALPSEPEKNNDVRSMATLYRRHLGGGRYHSWMVDRDEENERVARAIHDPAYIAYYSQACTVQPLTYEEFADYIQWVEAHEAKQARPEALR